MDNGGELGGKGESPEVSFLKNNYVVWILWCSFHA